MNKSFTCVTLLHIITFLSAKLNEHEKRYKRCILKKLSNIVKQAVKIMR